MQTLKKVIADGQVAVTVKENEGASPASPMRPDIMRTFDRLTDIMWPGVVTLPSMAVGASDSRYLRGAGIPVYSLSGLFNERDDNPAGSCATSQQLTQLQSSDFAARAHGRDVKSFFEGQTFMYEIVKSLAKATEVL